MRNMNSISEELDELYNIITIQIGTQNQFSQMMNR